VLRHFADAVDPQAGQRVQSELDNVSSLVNKWASPQEIAASANNAAATLDQLVQQLRAQRYGENFTARVMASIAADSQIALQGERSAEQAAMALDTLAVAYAKNAKLTNEQELRAAINKLFQQLDNPSAYNAPQFAAQMQRVRVLVPRSQAASRGQ
jgi:hypothetical protein